MKNINNKTRNRIAIYGGNFFGNSLGNLVNLKIGNPTGAILYGSLDILSKLSKKVKSNKLTRLLKAGGLAYYGASSISDLWSFANSDYSQIAQFPFNASMAYQLGKDTLDTYGATTMNSFVKDVKDTGRYLRDKVSNLKGIGNKKRLEEKLSEEDGGNILGERDIELSELSPKDAAKLSEDGFKKWEEVTTDDDLIVEARMERVFLSYIK